MRKYVDFEESYSGDIVFNYAGNFGDISITETDYEKAAYQIVRTILNCKPGEYTFDPAIGIDMEEFNGEPNTERVGFLMADKIRKAIALASSMFENEVSVEPVPTSATSISFLIALPFQGGDKKYVTAFDMRDNRILTLATA